MNSSLYIILLCNIWSWRIFVLCLCMLCRRSLHSQQADGTGTEPAEQVAAYQQPGLDYSLQRRDATPVYPHMITSTQHIQSEYGKCDSAPCHCRRWRRRFLRWKHPWNSVSNPDKCDDDWQRGCMVYHRFWTSVKAVFILLELGRRKGIWKSLYWDQLVLNLQCMGLESTPQS